MTLNFGNGKTSRCEIITDGRKYITFKAIDNCNIKYCVNKETGKVQVAPYWTTYNNLSVEM